MSVSEYPRETVEYVRVADVVVNGQPAATYDVAVVEEHERPTVWVPRVDLGGGVGGFQIGGLARGTYRVFVRVGTVVVEVGGFEVT